MSTIEAPTYVSQMSDGPGRPRRILLGMMVAVFFSGGVIGSGSTLMVVNRRIEENEKHNPEKSCGKIVSELEEKLSLSQEQTAKVDRIMKEHLAALDRLRRETFLPLIREQFKQMEDQVNSVLDEQQSAQWHAWLEERRSRVCGRGASHKGQNRTAKEAGEGAPTAPKSRLEKSALKPAEGAGKSDAPSDGSGPESSAR